MGKSVNIAVVGSGYVGLVAAVCFAEMGHQVTCVDNDPRKVAALQGGDTLIHEEHLPELLNRYRNTKVTFTTDLGSAAENAAAIFIAVGTPQSETGDADLSYVEAVACEIARHLTSYKVIVEKSTVPVYTNEWIRRSIERNGIDRKMFDVVSNPEFLREGSAVGDFLHPDRIVVGADSERAAQVLQDIYAPLTDGSYYKQANIIPGPFSADAPPPLLLTSTKSAEIIKHASNAFLALKISFINAVSNLCEATDANVQQVAQGMGLDSRIGPRFLRPGIGYGGSCFPKDVAAFRSVADQMGVDFSLLTEVERINATQKKRFLAKVRAALWTLRGKKLGVLGLAFKGDTDDIRDSPAIEMVQMLLAEGCSVCAFDPAAVERTKAVLPESDKVSYSTDAYAAAEDADALLILTDWAEFGKLDMKKLRTALRYPIMIDGRNMFEPATVAAAGLTYYSVGRPAAHPGRAEANA
ncbi:nucleotide sugar dehydrogenase [Terriglobus roseus DSM 18391]|uniref:UDP-glucose 6-dehydrogenase n=1 Tax=Terriglobus roseus (strain DSM 18391 / NRRL B-41598 / KBS 63) TaxID=926566 RepID=I3ZEU6_TERRK|nr:UDP-glucose/GDP-mannose dehydrogenase family protein [Terriglobus roseus]AFL87764.1 nucleotide sugar dehydrogenase [Terriglobus roseus DSM 18391]